MIANSIYKMCMDIGHEVFRCEEFGTGHIPQKILGGGIKSILWDKIHQIPILTLCGKAMSTYGLFAPSLHVKQ